jgi:hypothetical protein
VIFCVADGSDYAVATLKELVGELTTEAAADSGDKPCSLFHSEFSFFNGQCAVVAALAMFLDGTTSSIIRSALSVRGYGVM